jgi:hypothetical protein
MPPKRRPTVSNKKVVDIFPCRERPKDIWQLVCEGDVKGVGDKLSAVDTNAVLQEKNEYVAPPPHPL